MQDHMSPDKDNDEEKGKLNISQDEDNQDSNDIKVVEHRASEKSKDNDN